MGNAFEPHYIWLDKVDSTNSYCMKKAEGGEPEGLAIAAFVQEKGRGQRGNSWESQEGANLTFSLLLRPIFLKVEEQFFLSKAIALSVCDWINVSGLHAKVKWPNDIYVGDKKVCGILIENSFSGVTLDVSVVGIGLNLNQKKFPNDLPNPTSITLLTGKEYRPELVLVELVTIIQKRYLQIKEDKLQLDTDYLKNFYRLGEKHFFNANNEKIKAKIIGVKHTGELLLEDELGKQHAFMFKEVAFVI